MPAPTRSTSLNWATTAPHKTSLPRREPSPSPIKTSVTPSPSPSPVTPPPHLTTQAIAALKAAGATLNPIGQQTSPIHKPPISLSSITWTQIAANAISSPPSQTPDSSPMAIHKPSTRRLHRLLQSARWSDLDWLIRRAAGAISFDSPLTPMADRSNQRLKEGAMASDGHGLQGARLTITIGGTNDIPTIDASTNPLPLAELGGRQLRTRHRSHHRNHHLHRSRPRRLHRLLRHG